jgi:UDP-N-acetyl-D-mannosaminuronic acid dehydrogenase
MIELSVKVFEILDHRFHLVHAPHGWYSLNEKEHGVNQQRIIGGVCDCCHKASMQFYGGGADNVHDDGRSNSYSSSLKRQAILKNPV